MQCRLTGERKFFTVGAVIFGSFILLAVFGPLLVEQSPYESSLEPFAEPSSGHWLGGNDLGQDIWSELVYGTRVSLCIGIASAALATGTALLLALIAGYSGGLTDRLLMRLVDVVMCLPYLPFVIVLGAFIGSGTGVQILVISVVMWAEPCRELRSQVLRYRQSEYVQACLAMGGSGWYVIRHHLLPDLLPLVVPQFVRIAQRSILLESSLSFLGLGDPVVKSWGSMLFFANNRTAFLTGAWLNWVLPPGLCITLVCLSLALMGFSLKYTRGFAYFPWGSFLRPQKNIPQSIQTVQTARKNSKELAIHNLSVSYRRCEKQVDALNNLSLCIRPGSCTGIVGESGSGKSTLAMTIMGLLKFPAQVTQGCILHGRQDLLASGVSMTSVRGREIAYIPQNAMNVLNPIQTIRSQLVESIVRLQKLSAAEAATEADRLLGLVGISAERGSAFSHQLSGGMRQRVVIALALTGRPSVLIADEATTGLDVLIEHDIIELLLGLREKLNLALLFITHDLPLIACIADYLAVIHNAELVEEGPANQVCCAPQHPYTKKLLTDFPRLHTEKFGHPSPKAFVRPDAAAKEGQAPLLKVSEVGKIFRAHGRCSSVQALSDVSFSLYQGEVFGVIGGSGSGKTTLGRIIMGLHRPDSGQIYFREKELTALNEQAYRSVLTRHCHYVFQDPYQSLHPLKTIEETIGEPLLIRGMSAKQIRPEIERVLQDTGLPSDSAFLLSTPAELSGGQRQRLAFARAVITKPALIIADEPTSMLDVSLRMNLLHLMEDLRTRYRTTFLFITHDLALAHHFCDRLLVLQQGRAVEYGNAENIVRDPQHAYTQALLGAVRQPDFSCLLPASEAV